LKIQERFRRFFRTDKIHAVANDSNSVSPKRQPRSHSAKRGFSFEPQGDDSVPSVGVISAWWDHWEACSFNGLAFFSAVSLLALPSFQSRADAVAH
jgi:hypothetical protein